MPDSYDWQMARRVARLAAHAPGRGMSRADLAVALGNPWNFDVWVKLAYVTRQVDCVRDYVVAPTLGPGPGPVTLGGRGVPPTHVRVARTAPGGAFPPPVRTPGPSAGGEPLFP